LEREKGAHEKTKTKTGTPSLAEINGRKAALGYSVWVIGYLNFGLWTEMKYFAVLDSANPV
jgi:hypothetical protein